MRSQTWSGTYHVGCKPYNPTGKWIANLFCYHPLSAESQSKQAIHGKYDQELGLRSDHHIGTAPLRMPFLLYVCGLNPQQSSLYKILYLIWDKWSDLFKVLGLYA